MGRGSLEIQRYKGLGEMNAEQLWSTTLDPQRRKMVKVSIEDVAEAEKIVSPSASNLVASSFRLSSRPTVASA